MSEWAYHQRGCLAYVVELWDLFAQLGIPRAKRFVDHYTQLTRKDFLALWKLDREVNQGRIFKPWRTVQHPQLGTVEVGGFDARVGISNPPFEKLAETCANQCAAFLRVASMLPQVQLELLSSEKMGDGHTRVQVRITNGGYLGTYGLSSAKVLTHVEPLRMTMQGEGVSVVAPAESVIDIGHLAGWGMGLNHGISIFMTWTRGNSREKTVSLVVSGHGVLQLRVGSCRVGWQTLPVAVA